MISNKSVDINSLSKEEQELALKILSEYSTTGSSETFNELLVSDYKEIPVDIITFVTDDRYLGKAWHLSDGTCKLYPYWENKLKEIFPDNTTTSVNTVILSGARGLGKSEIAITISLYLMYRVMCLKDPLAFYNLKPTETIAFSFMNITEALAIDIGVSKFQKTVQLSPWFMERGTLSGTREKTWNPPSYIKIIIGSQPRHVIGQATFCLDGDTEIVTTEGIKKLRELKDKSINVYTLNSDNEIEISDKCIVKQTLESRIEMKIELEDGSVIKCTPNHRLMLKDGSFKEAQFLTSKDELMDYTDMKGTL